MDLVLSHELVLSPRLRVIRRILGALFVGTSALRGWIKRAAGLCASWFGKVTTGQTLNVTVLVADSGSEDD